MYVIFVLVDFDDARMELCERRGPILPLAASKDIAWEEQVAKCSNA